MNEQTATETAQKIIKNIFGTDDNISLGFIKQKFAFDLVLPNEVQDSITKEEAWSIVGDAKKYITQDNMEKHDRTSSWMLEKREFHNIGEIVEAWKEVNYLTTNRLSDTTDTIKSDTVYRSESVYHSTNCFSCKQLLFCDSCSDSEYLIASKRSANSNFCIRLDDSTDCSNSFCVNYSNKVINSLFIQDCFDLYECMFCSHLACKKFCVANMQFPESEYREIKPQIIQWIMES